MRVCRSAAELSEAFEAVKRLGQNNFSDSGVFIEKYIQRARHLEVQVFGDGRGEVLALGVRDCSVQRRNQKVLEETPAPNLPAGMAEELCAAAIKLARAVNYRSAGTVEFVYDSEAQRFYFLEVNTRLQVEHGVTEQVWGVDLVRWMIELAAGDLPPLAELAKGLAPSGHAIQARLYAEDPGRDFQPSPGLLTAVAFPEADGKALRIDTWVEAGCEIPPYFDPMIAKVITWAPDRESASAALDDALAETVLYGVESNRDCLRQILADAPFAAGNPTCARSSRMRPSPAARRGPAAWKISPTGPPPSRCSVPAPRPRYRTTPAASATGRSACRRRGRWTTAPCAWATACWVIMRKAPPAWKSP
ncbi:Acetyl-/propionyl-coenzyme A carboxylase alpha chain [compost metagenome]